MPLVRVFGQWVETPHRVSPASRHSRRCPRRQRTKHPAPLSASPEKISRRVGAGPPIYDGCGAWGSEISRPTRGFLQRIEFYAPYVGELSVALIFIVERGHTGVLLRYGFRRLGQLTCREWLTFQQRLIRHFGCAISGDGILQGIELFMLNLRQLPIALAFVVERGRTRLVGRYAFRRLRQMTLLDLAFELRLIGPFLGNRFGPAYFRRAAYL